jgi:hypothetical protein
MIGAAGRGSDALLFSLLQDTSGLVSMFRLAPRGVTPPTMPRRAVLDRRQVGYRIIVKRGRDIQPFFPVPARRFAGMAPSFDSRHTVS